MSESSGLIDSVFKRLDVVLLVLSVRVEGRLLLRFRLGLPGLRLGGGEDFLLNRLALGRFRGGGDGLLLGGRRRHDGAGEVGLGERGKEGVCSRSSSMRTFWMYSAAAARAFS